MNTAQRRQAVLDVFEEHEDADVLLSCLPRSPALWMETDAEVLDRMARLEERGLLADQDGFYSTTPEGRDVLIAYIKDTDIEGDE